MIDEGTIDLSFFPYSMGNTINIDDISRSSLKKKDKEGAVLNIPMYDTSLVCH
jgi:hypothetical protein